jgi:hypothetical protein
LLGVVSAVDATEGIDRVFVGWQGHTFRARVTQGKLKSG